MMLTMPSKKQSHESILKLTVDAEADVGNQAVREIFLVALLQATEDELYDWAHVLREQWPELLLCGFLFHKI